MINYLKNFMNDRDNIFNTCFMIIFYFYYLTFFLYNIFCNILFGNLLIFVFVHWSCFFYILFDDLYIFVFVHQSSFLYIFVFVHC